MLTLPKNRGGFGIPTTLHICKKLQLAKRSALRNSAHSEIRQIWSDTSSKNICTDSLLYDSDGTSEVKKTLQASLISQAEFHVHSLILQGQAVKVITECISKSGIGQWSRIVEALPDFLFRFVKKALQQQLPTASNLEENCQSQLHTVWKIDPADEQTPPLTLCVPSRSLLRSPQQNTGKDCSLDRLTQISQAAFGGRSTILVVHPNRYRFQAVDQTGYRALQRIQHLHPRTYSLPRDQFVKIQIKIQIEQIQRSTDSFAKLFQTHSSASLHSGDLSLGYRFGFVGFLQRRPFNNLCEASSELSRDAIKYSFLIYKLRNSVTVQS